MIADILKVGGLALVRTMWEWVYERRLFESHNIALDGIKLVAKELLHRME